MDKIDRLFELNDACHEMSLAWEKTWNPMWLYRCLFLDVRCVVMAWFYSLQTLNIDEMRGLAHFLRWKRMKGREIRLHEKILAQEPSPDEVILSLLRLYQLNRRTKEDITIYFWGKVAAPANEKEARETCPGVDSNYIVYVLHVIGSHELADRIDLKNFWRMVTDKETYRVIENLLG